MLPAILVKIIVLSATSCIPSWIGVEGKSGALKGEVFFPFHYAFASKAEKEELVRIAPKSADILLGKPMMADELKKEETPEVVEMAFLHEHYDRTI